MKYQYSKYVFLILVLFTLSSCYHAQIITDKTPSSQVIDIPWAHGFVFGLVPPDIVKTASECPNGLARVDTEISFLNGLVSAITFNLYTPMHIKVTCAADGTASVEQDNAKTITVLNQAAETEKLEAFQKASEESFKSGKSVFVAFK